MKTEKSEHPNDDNDNNNDIRNGEREREKNARRRKMKHEAMNSTTILVVQKINNGSG